MASTPIREVAMRSRVPSTIVIIAGIVFAVAGVVTYAVVSTTLAAQKITVSEDANYFAGQTVSQPWQAYAQARSEEHTSELQSHVNLVCRLLLEKKKINKKRSI